uniref:Uncharacterized protein n=1 Tax=Heterorhabditis bacteriophora TaxID=37862 RepID=A0A1I7WRU4_HETBA
MLSSPFYPKAFAFSILERPTMQMCLLAALTITDYFYTTASKLLCPGTVISNLILKYYIPQENFQFFVLFCFIAYIVNIFNMFKIFNSSSFIFISFFFFSFCITQIFFKIKYFCFCFS